MPGIPPYRGMSRFTRTEVDLLRSRHNFKSDPVHDVQSATLKIFIIFAFVNDGGRVEGFTKCLFVAYLEKSFGDSTIARERREGKGGREGGREGKREMKERERERERERGGEREKSC